MTTRTIAPADQDRYDLPWDHETRDVVCARDVATVGDCERTTLHFNIERRHVDHSPSGWEWGYGGSGPSDFALNILALFIDPPADPGPEPPEDAPEGDWELWLEGDCVRVKLYDGTYVHEDLYRLHQDFKSQFVARLPHEGGTISGAVIERWIAEHRNPDGEAR